MFTNSYIIISSIPIEKTFWEKVEDFIILYKEFFYLLLFILLLCLFAYFLYKNYDLKKITSGNYKIILLFISFPFLLLLLIPIFRDRFTLDGWFSFLGGYVGVGGAVGTVWWQLNEEKRKKEEELILSTNENIYSFLILSHKISQDFSVSCGNYLLNKVINNGIVFTRETFSYEENILINFISKINDTKITKDIIYIITLFSSFHKQAILSLETKGKNFFKNNTFYLKSFEIFMITEKLLNKLLEKIGKKEINISSANFIENIENEFKILKKNINEIEKSYPSYLEKEDISIEEIKEKLKKYSIKYE